MIDVGWCVVTLHGQANEALSGVGGHGDFNPALFEQTPAQRLRVLRWHGNDYHLRPITVLRDNAEAVTSR